MFDLSSLLGHVRRQCWKQCVSSHKLAKDRALRANVLYADFRIFGIWIEDEKPILLLVILHPSNLLEYLKK